MAALISGCLAAAAFAADPGKPAPAANPELVTVYYERSPDGTIRQVSNSSPLPAAIKTEQASNNSIQNPPLPPAHSRPQILEFRTIPNSTSPAVPFQRPPEIKPAVATAKPLDAPIVTPIPTVAPATAVVQPVKVQLQPAVLPGLPPVNAKTTSRKQVPSTAPAEPKLLQPTQPPTLNQTDIPKGDRTETLSDYNIETRPPSMERLYRMEPERELKLRIKQEMESRPGEARERNVEFPKYAPLTDEVYQAREMGGLIKQIEPQYVCHGRLYFEELNSDRYGWDIGILQPFLSSAYALKDMALLPYHFGTRPYQRFDASPGKCFPGDPVPYLLYPPEVSVTGGGMEATMFLAAFLLVP